MSTEQACTSFRAGFIAVIGRPNVGKSTLVNALVGERLAPTSPVPQTTRRRLLGILTTDETQLVFVDTPGLHEPVHPLGRWMVEDAEQALVDADVVLAVVDGTRVPGPEDDLVLGRARAVSAPRFVVLNKSDAVAREDHRAEFRALAGPDTVHETSALRGDGLPALLAAVSAALPEHPAYFPADQVSDAMERDIAADLVRQAAMRRLAEELPHAVAVKVNTWTERENGVLYIQADLYVERDSQKGIVIGRGGRMLKSIGTLARESLTHWLDQPIYLDLEVKVLKAWRKDERALRYLGFTRA
jgi:GTP-binding protein Era